MATAPVLLSIEEYLRTSYHPDADFVDGIVEERVLGEYEHGKLQGLLFFIFQMNSKRWDVDPVVEQRIRVAPHRVRVCDVAVLRADAPREKVTLTPPLLCIEVLSTEDRVSRATRVLSDYLAMGVENIWLVDPVRRTVSRFDASGLQPMDPTKLTVGGTPIMVDLTEAFDSLS